MDSLFADRLKECLAKKGISQQKLAAMVGVSPSAVSKWTVAESSIDSQNLLKVCQVLDLSADYLLGLTDSPKKSPDIERTISDATGLSHSSIDLLHRKLVSNREESTSTRETINRVLSRSLFYDWVDCIDDYCLKNVCSSPEYREKVNSIRDLLISLSSGDQILSEELSEYFFDPAYRDKVFSDGGFSEEDEKKVEKLQHNARVKEQNLAIFTLTDTASQLARGIAKEMFDTVLQTAIKEHLLKIKRWIDLGAAGNYSQYCTTIQDDESEEEMTYEEFLKQNYPSYAAFSKQIEAELIAAASLSKKKK